MLDRNKPLLLATHNEGKRREMEALLRPYGIKVFEAGAPDIEEIEETGATFMENASLKASAAARETGFIALSDDSGLCVEALGGAPGIFSARWAGQPRDFARACARVEKALREKGALKRDERRAHFSCALALAFPTGRVRVFEGKVEGVIVFPPRGKKGFGYDPIFEPLGESMTFGEMPPLQKDAISHRARAFALFEAACLSS